jgi:hypothetical protein
MPRGKELSPQMRSRICELYSIYYSTRRIHNIYLEIPVSTIKYTIQKEALRNNNQSLPQVGPPRKLLDKDRDHLHNIAAHQDPYIKIQDLINKVDQPVSKDTVCRAFQEMHKKKWL